VVVSYVAMPCALEKKSNKQSNKPKQQQQQLTTMSKVRTFLLANYQSPKQFDPEIIPARFPRVTSPFLSRLPGFQEMCSFFALQFRN